MPSPFTTPVAVSTPFEPLRNPDSTGQASIITSQNVQDAIEEVFQNAPGKQARFTLALLNNSSLGNNQRVGYSELLPNVPVVLPRKCRLKEITFSNASANADATFRIYKRSPPISSATPGGTATLLHTWTFNNSLSAFQTGLDLLFLAGEEILIVFIDIGDNPSDVAMVLFFVNDDTP